MRKYILFFIIILLFTSAHAKDEPKEDITLKILITRLRGSLQLSCQGGLRVKDEKNHTLLSTEKTLVIQHDGEKMWIEKSKNEIPLHIIIEPLSNKGILNINGKRYRGALEVFLRNGLLDLINIVKLEEYLYGVVPREFRTKYIEMEKAQAIVARTFAISHMGKYKKLGFDFSSGPQFQVYGGYDAEDPLCNKAVDETKGLVLTHKGKIVKYPLYHSTCGGATTSNEVAFLTSPIEYLRGTRCFINPSSKVPLCHTSPYNHWKITITKDTLIQNANLLLNKHIKNIYGLLVTKRDKFGRVWEVTIVTKKEDIPVRGDKIRDLLKFKKAGRFRRLYSTMFTIKRIGDIDHLKWEIEGKGWGHGVGMCQFGALEMAKKGHTFEEILKKYYNNVEITKYQPAKEKH